MPERTVRAHAGPEKGRYREPFETVLRRFRRSVTDGDVLGDARRKRFYMKPSDRRRAKIARSKRRVRRDEFRQQRRRKRRGTGDYSLI